MKTLAQLFRLQPDLVAIQDYASGEFLLAGERFGRITGRSPEATVGQRDTGWWLSPAAGEQIRRDLEKAGESLSSRRDRQATALPGDHLDFLRFDLGGHELLLSRQNDATARPTKVLQAREKVFNAIFRSAPIALSVSRVDDNYAFIDVNEAWSRQFSLSRQEIAGRGNRDPAFWGEAEDCAAVFAALEQIGEIRRYETWRRRADGEFMLCQISARLFAVDGERLLLMAEEDITERRLIELQIRELNATLENRVQERTTELEAAVAELKQTLQHLEQAQGELVRTEKLAALGSLVAGIAHELNTPIGNALIVASTLSWETAEFAKASDSGLRRSTLANFVAQTTQANELIVSSLQRASELINSFKQVAVDQTSSLCRRFELKEIIDEILAILHPRLKKTPYLILHEVPAGLEFNSYPGPLGQVVTNLIDNAIIHGFDGRDRGTIQLQARKIDGDTIELRVTDDGVGIPAAALPRIYDPFFTTKLGKGGSGLGLNIVHSIVTHKLGGKIAVASEVGRGTCFTISLPCTAPSRAENAAAPFSS